MKEGGHADRRWGRGSEEGPGPEGGAEGRRGWSHAVTAVLYTLSLGAVRADDPAPLRDALVALVSFDPVLGDLAGNVRRIQALVGEALRAGTNIVVLPEQATTGSGITREQAASGLAIPYPFLDLAGLAVATHEAKAMIVLGVAERAADAARFFNTAVAVMPDGSFRTQCKRLASAEGFGWNARGDRSHRGVPTA